MMVPFDGSGGPQQGQPSVAPPLQRPPMPSGHVSAPSPVMPPGHHPPMNGAPYGRHGSMTMPGQPPYPMPPSPARQGSFTGSMPPSSSQFSSHPPLHSPHQSQGGPPMHPAMGHPSQQMHRSGSMGRHNPNGVAQGMPPMMNQHDPIRNSSSQGGHSSRQQQQYMGGSSNVMSGSWQSERDTPFRRDMIQHIVKLLKKDKGGSPDSVSKLPQMAKQLEVSLYRNARSFEAYRDMSTLKNRLQQIAVEVSRKARADGRKEEPSIEPSRQPYPPPEQNGMRGDIGGSGSPFMGTSSSNGNRMVSLDELNPMSQGYNGSSQGYGASSRQPPAPLPMNDRMNGRSSVPPPPPPPPPADPQQAALSQPNRNDPEWKIRIRHKQQRLLLLHHSAKCPHEDGRCPVTPHCTDMKRLWKHMEGCKDNNCRISHCFSSRAILSHYRKCKDANCPACGPVRDTVRKSRSSRPPSSASTGALMNGMRGIPPGPAPPIAQTSQGQPLGMSSDSIGGSSNGSSFMPAPPSVPQPFPPRQPPSMPPPPMPPVPPPVQPSSSMPYPAPAPPSGQALPANPHYRPGSANGSSTAVQPLFRPEQGSTDNRSVTSSTSRQSESTSPMPTGSSWGGGASSSRNDSEWQKIRHKQQRLLLLRHASRCQHEAGRCPVTPHCASMKQLWEHIAHCKNQQCTVQHCLSSRYVLSHYRRCKDARCPACGPVRETIRKSREREISTRQPNDPPPEAEDLDPHNVGMEPTSPDRGVSPSDPFQPDSKRVKMDHASPPQVEAPPPLSNEEVEPIEAVLESQPDPEEPAKTPSMPKDDTMDTSKGGSTDFSLLNSFTIRELDTHLASLDRKAQLPPTKLKSKCVDVLKGLQTHQHGWVFNCPVDPVELGLPDYFDIIKKPMDLGTIQKKLDSGAYHSVDDFKTDVYLTFDNAMTYNENGSVVYDMAKELKTKFNSDLKKLNAQLESEDRERRQNERACTLCGCEKLLFEPPVYFCNGMNCQSQRIRRNSHFYIGGNNQYFWCSTCYNELDDKIPIELADMTIVKSDLKKKKNDEVHEESWVQCDTCERWVHQICGLFNTRQNKEHHSEYCCPRCMLEKRKAAGDIPSPRPPGAADLPRTTLSEWLEQHVTKKIDLRKRQLAEEKAQNEGVSLEDANRSIEAGGPIIIRQVTAMDRKLEVRELMKKRYAHKNYPDEFPFRCKCMLVFQHIDGVDVVLFALYLYEHGADNPPPNQRCVYISYLDSVHFMRPRKLRTFVYHEILIAYLDYARRNGFATVHIWACPPLKGDDYIFYAKPEDQKTPRDSRLRQWYIDMLQECQKRNIVGKITNMYDLYFANEALDATAVPYLEGDYFPGEAENIIKMLEEGGGKKGGGGGKKKKTNKAGKNKGNTGTRSSGVDEEALIASGAFEGARSFKDLDRDQVMAKLGETIQPMKDSFIVAYLNWSGAKEDQLVVPEAIEKARLEYAAKDDGELAGSKRDALGSVRDASISSNLDSSGRPIKVIDDDAEDLDCEFLNNRQAFLNLCRGNHYQFDELRRAKHTSMMVLWHLHNRDAPKFVQQCVVCNREILSGKRFHCNTCPDYDLCQECFKDPSANRGTCTHQLQAIAVDPDAGQERSGLTEAERQARQRNLMLHIQLIEHASRCNSKTCSSSNCAKMKSYLHHARICPVKVQGGCKICKRIWTLLRIHAQKCKDPNCPIPQCTAIREKMRQLQKQQQAMDDRRRLEMNRHLRFSVAGGVPSH